MQGKKVSFFTRQTLLQDGGNSTTYYSDTYDLTPDTQILIEARPYAVIGTSPSIQIDFETTNVLHAADGEWHNSLSFSAITGGGGTPQRAFLNQATSPSGQVGRVKVTLTGTDAGITFEVVGIARTD
jgi:hypothetical protein